MQLVLQLVNLLFYNDGLVVKVFDIVSSIVVVDTELVLIRVVGVRVNCCWSINRC